MVLYRFHGHLTLAHGIPIGQKQPLQTDNVTDESDAPLLVPDRFYSSQTPVAYS